MPYSPGGYCWMAVAREPHNLKLEPKEIEKLESDCAKMEELARTLETTIAHYHELCKRYEKEAGTLRAEHTFKQMKETKAEIVTLAKHLKRNLDDSSEIVHLDS